MRVPLHVVEERRRQLAGYLQQRAYAPLRDLCDRFEASEATVRRDLAALAAQKQIVRTYGGALTEYNRRFPSFRERAQLRRRAKRKIAVAARSLLRPGSCCFLDFGTTVFALAEELVRRPLRGLQVVTNSLPIAELLAPAPDVRVFLLGGEALPRQSVLVGETACDAVRFHRIDQAFFSVEAGNDRGVWNSQEELVSLQQTVLSQAAQKILCLDAAKVNCEAPVFLAPWTEFDLIISDAEESTVCDFGGQQSLLV